MPWNVHKHSFSIVISTYIFHLVMHSSNRAGMWSNKIIKPFKHMNDEIIFFPFLFGSTTFSNPVKYFPNFQLWRTSDNKAFISSFIGQVIQVIFWVLHTAHHIINGFILSLSHELLSILFQWQRYKSSDDNSAIA